ncbi:MAG: ribokinase [Paenibacillaceae bacterium]|nr:ribokinase [Paenibacillaceae bacterium]
MTTVYILGELNVDLIASAADVMPEFNREKLLDRFDVVLGSSSAITACVLAGLGVDVKMVSLVGDDSFGHFCIDQLRQKGVDTAHVHLDPHRQTGVTLSLSTAKDRALMTYMGTIPCLRPEHMPGDMLERADHLHFGSYFLQEAMRGDWAPLYERARAAGVTTSFDTGWDPREDWDAGRIAALLPHTDLFMPSEDEIERIFPGVVEEGLASALPQGHHIVAVKRGSQGSSYVDEGGNRYDLAAQKITPVDTTGAGDSFNAGFICGYLQGLRGTELLELANACGSLACLRIGGASEIPTMDDVQKFMREQSRA